MVPIKRQVFLCNLVTVCDSVLCRVPLFSHLAWETSGMLALVLMFQKKKKKLTVFL